MTPAATTILVVDDQEAGRFVKVQTLRRAGFTVVEAATGADALALVESGRPDVVVLDVNLPDISGLEVARRIRELAPEPPAIQILQVSSTATEAADRVRGLQHGADVYLTEPVEAEVLVATTLALLRVRRAETALADALENERHARGIAEDANRLKDEFIATLSHELRTPLNAMMGWIWQLRHQPGLAAETRERALESLERNARLQAQLISDLLDVSRASRGKMQLELRIVDLQSIVRAAIDATRDASDRKGLELGLDLSPVTVVCDPARVQQVFNNLLINAVQFTPRGGRIDVAVFSDHDDAVVTVRDTGAGIDPAFVPYVFDQFRQGEAGLSRKHGGLGLGLAVVRQLVDLHAGTVTVSSEGSGKGATFTVRLPRETAVHARDDLGAGALALQGVRVLVDSADPDAESLTAVLEACGARVVAPPASAGTTLQDVDVIVAPDKRAAARHAGDVPVIVPASPLTTDIVRQILRTAAKSTT